MKRFLQVFSQNKARIAAIAALASVSFASNAQALDQLRLRLEAIAEGYHAHFFIGKERGYYRDEGIDLTIAEGQGSVNVLKLISEGTDVIGRADYGTMVKAVGQGVSVKAIFGEMQDSPICIISRADAPVKTPADMAGKLIAMAPVESSAQLFPILLTASKVDPKSLNVVNPAIGAKNVLLLQKRVDAIAGYSNIHPAQLKAGGLDTINFRFADYGVGTLSNGLVANVKFLAEKPDLVKRFLRATVRSYAEAMKHPDEAVDIMLKQYPIRAKERDVYIQMLKDTFPLLHTKANQGHPIGWMADADWARTQDILVEAGGIPAKQPLDRYYTNEFVPQ